MKKTIYYVVKLKTYTFNNKEYLSKYKEVKVYRIGYKRLKYSFSIELEFEEDAEERIKKWLINNGYNIKNYKLQEL